MENYNQLCVWPGTTLEESTGEDLEKFFQEQGFRVKFAEEVITLPDVKDSRVVEGTGGRHDLLFYIHNEDITKFAIPRLRMGIRWWEDVFYNHGEGIYPQSIIDKYPKTW